MSRLLARHVTPSGARITLHLGDITLETTTAIVNAANSRLAHGGGVAGAIVRGGGAAIQEESDAFVRLHGPVPTGMAAWTGPGDLPMKGIIHAVGPVWGEGNEDAKLNSAARAAFALAALNECESVALPAISSGIFGFPKARCAAILVKAAVDFFDDHPVEPLQEIRFTLIDDETAGIFLEEFARVFGRESLLSPL